MGQDICSCISSNPVSSLPNRTSHREASVIKAPLTDLQVFTQPHYFILPQSYKSFCDTFQQRIKERFPTVTIFRNRQDLARFDGDGKINVLIITCSRPQDFQQLKLRQLHNFHMFTQIAIAQNLSLEEGSINQQDCHRYLGFRFACILKENSEEMMAFMEEAREGRAFYFCHRDYGHINRANLVFDYFFRQGEKSPSSCNHMHFFQWARNIPEGQELIERLQTITNEKAKDKQLVSNIWNQNVVCIKAVEMLRRIRNPCVLAHIAWFGFAIFKFIRASYQDCIRQLKKNNINVFETWVGLTKEDIETMKQKQHFMFSTFVTGSSQTNIAQPESRPGLTYYKFNINIQNSHGQHDPIVDLGFFSYLDKAIFNIQNVYQLVSFDHKNRIAQATYCSVGPEYTKWKDNSRYSTYHSQFPQNVSMMITYNVYFLYKRRVRHQLDLILALQFYLLFKRMALALLQTMPKNNKNVADAGGSQLFRTAISIDEGFHPSINLFDKIGDAELSTFNFEAAENSYKRISNRQTKIVKLLYLYNSRNDRRSFRQTLDEQRRQSQINQRPLVQPGCLFYAEKIFKAILKGYTDYRQALKTNRTNITNISDFFAQKYVTRLPNGKQDPNTKFPIHEEAYEYFPIYHMASKVSLDLETLNGEVGIQFTRMEIEKAKKKMDGLHFFLLPQDD